MSFGEVEHFATMLAGCESISNGNTTNTDAKYALSVLKLHANDAGLYAGQEGFLDSIKRGANNVKEWILKLIQAIRNWFKGSKKEKEIEKVVLDIEKMSEEHYSKLSLDVQFQMESLMEYAANDTQHLEEIVNDPSFESACSLFHINGDGIKEDIANFKQLGEHTKDGVFDLRKINKLVYKCAKLGTRTNYTAEAVERYVKQHVFESDQDTGAVKLAGKLLKACAVRAERIERIAKRLNDVYDRTVGNK